MNEEHEQRLAEAFVALATTAASAEQARVHELLAAQTEDGPCQDCLHTGTVVTSTDLTTETSRWPRFAPAADYHGYRAVSAVPMRLRGQNKKREISPTHGRHLTPQRSGLPPWVWTP